MKDGLKNLSTKKNSFAGTRESMDEKFVKQK